MQTTRPAALTFGPVPSRRLGRSLGINNIPPKFCSYSCLYCQVGRTLETEISPRTFYRPDEIRDAVVAQVEAARRAGEKIDYLTFVPDGEPTLDAHLGETIDLLRPLGIKIAVISNGSLVWHDDVKNMLSKVDWVSLKVDTVDEAVWRRLNRPHGDLRLPVVLQGMRDFARQYTGQLTTETMLVADVNDGPDSVAAVADFIGKLRPNTAYLAVPTRPPAEAFVRAPTEEAVVRAYNELKAKVAEVEYLIEYEGDAFAYTGNAEQDLLSITAVHPMAEEAVLQLVAKAGLNWNFIRTLLEQRKIKEVEFAGRRFYVRPTVRNVSGSDTPTSENR
jgi:wyosine [tRNA(Phe)-imidazoG37] synthetase (radical SAM superfamily)